MTELKRVASLPRFPKNTLGLCRGTILEATDELVATIGLEIGNRIAIGFDGKYIRSGTCAWSVQQLAEEIETGVWRIVGTHDLADPMRSARFAREVEEIELVN